MAKVARQLPPPQRLDVREEAIKPAKSGERAIVPGDDSMSIGATILLGVVGSFVGGFLGWLIFGKDFSEGALQPSGIIGSILGAIVALLVYRAVNRNSHTRVGV